MSQDVCCSGVVYSTWKIERGREFCCQIVPNVIHYTALVCSRVSLQSLSGTNTACFPVLEVCSRVTVEVTTDLAGWDLSEKQPASEISGRFSCYTVVLFYTDGIRLSLQGLLFSCFYALTQIEEIVLNWKQFEENQTRRRGLPRSKRLISGHLYKFDKRPNPRHDLGDLNHIITGCTLLIVQWNWVKLHYITFGSLKIHTESYVIKNWQSIL